MESIHKEMVVLSVVISMYLQLPIKISPEFRPFMVVMSLVWGLIPKLPEAAISKISL